MILSKNIKNLSDAELVEEYKATENYDFVGVLYQRHTQFVFAVSMKYLKNEDKCKDAVMEIFEKLMVDLLRFDIDNFKAWLHRVTRNHCLLSIRSEGYERKYQEKYKNDQSVFMEKQQDLYPDNEQKIETDVEILKEGILNLNGNQRKCVELFYIQQKCYADVSEITGFTMKEVKSYIQNGKRNLKNYMINNNSKYNSVNQIILLLIIFSNLL